MWGSYIYGPYICMQDDPLPLCVRSSRYFFLYVHDLCHAGFLEYGLHRRLKSFAIGRDSRDRIPPMLILT